MDIPRYRIGNDLTVLWAICNNDGTPFDLSGKGVRLFVTNERGMTEVVPTITTDKNGSITNVILWTFLGNNQKVLGKHTLTVEIVTADDKRVIKRDISDAFNLVARSEGEESGGEANAVDSGTIYLSTKLDVYRFGNARVEIGTNGNWFIDGYDTGRTALAGEPGIVHNIYTESDLGKEFDPDSKIDTFNAHAINAINNALKRMTLEQLQDLSLADLEEYDVLAYNGNAWLNVPFRDLLNIFKGPSESSSGIGDSVWKIDEQGNIWTDKQVLIKNNLIIDGDTSSGGEGESVIVGVQGIRVNGGSVVYPNSEGIVELTISGGGGTADLSDYYTKSQSDARYLALSGGTINGNSVEPLIINSSASSVGIRLRINGANAAYIGYGGTSVGTYMYNYDSGYYIGIREGEAYFNNGAYNTLIHSGNIGSYNAGGLATPRTIWGQSFDGTGDVSGDLNLGYAKLTFGTDGNIYHIGWNSSTNMFSYKSYYGHYFSTDGVERLRITQSGNVGIGTTSPNRKFHVLSPDFTCMAVQRNQPSGYGAVIEFCNTANKLGQIGWDNEYAFRIADTSGKSLISGKYDSLNIGDYFTISNTATNPLIQIVHGGYNWYIQGYQSNYLYIGAGSAKSLRIKYDGEVYCPQNLIVAGDVASA